MSTWWRVWAVGDWVLVQMYTTVPGNKLWRYAEEFIKYILRSDVIKREVIEPKTFGIKLYSPLDKRFCSHTIYIHNLFSTIWMTDPNMHLNSLKVRGVSYTLQPSENCGLCDFLFLAQLYFSYSLYHCFPQLKIRAQKIHVKITESV